MASNSKLTANQRKALVALMTTSSVRAAAAACGLHERTMHRYLHNNVFVAELNRQEAVMIDAGTRELIQEFERSIETMRQVRDDQEASPPARLRAAQVMTEQMVRVRELRDIEHRLTRLEELINEQTRPEAK